MLLSNLFTLFLRHTSFLGFVALVAKQDLLDVSGGVVFNLSDPVTYVIEAVGLGAVVGKYDALRALVVGLRYCAEPLLPCSVPNLNFDVLAVQVNRFYFEIDADRYDVRLLDVFLTQPEEQTRLAHLSVSDDDEFEQVIKWLLSPCHV